MRIFSTVSLIKFLRRDYQCRTVYRTYDSKGINSNIFLFIFIYFLKQSWTLEWTQLAQPIVFVHSDTAPRGTDQFRSGVREQKTGHDESRLWKSLETQSVPPQIFPRVANVCTGFSNGVHRFTYPMNFGDESMCCDFTKATRVPDYRGRNWKGRTANFYTKNYRRGTRTVFS